MNSQTIVMCVVALILGMLLANMLKSVCGCKVVEGQQGYECQSANSSGRQCAAGCTWDEDGNLIGGESCALRLNHPNPMCMDKANNKDETCTRINYQGGGQTGLMPIFGETCCETVGVPAPQPAAAPLPEPAAAPLPEPDMVEIQSKLDSFRQTCNTVFNGSGS